MLNVIHRCLVVVLELPEDKRAHCWGFRGMTGCEVRDLSYKVSV